MKIAIRRHGVVVKTLEIKDKKVAIGSGSDCFIHLEDPYIADHVADLVYKDEDWWLIDTGLGLDGIMRQGARVLEEPILPGETYGVGAFEIVAEGFQVSPTTLAGMKSAEVDPSAIATQVESLEGLGAPKAPSGPATRPGEAPATIQVPLDELRGGGGEPAQQEKKTFRFKPVTAGDEQVPTPPLQNLAPQPQAAVAEKSGKASPIRLVLMIAVAMAVVLLVLAVAVSGKKKPADDGQQVVEEAEAPRPVIVTPDQLVAEGDAHAAALEIEQAIEKWEQALNRGATGDVRARYVRTTMTLARTYAARPDQAAAKRYFSKVIQYGDENDALVLEARERLTAE